MKRILLLVLLIYLMVISPPGSFCQVSLENIAKNELPLEKIVLLSDRDIYAVNERISFSAFYSISQDFQGRIWSTVLYLELTSSEGKSIIQEKFPLNLNGTNGSVLIPDGLPSGIYYLKAYTRWMMNFPPEFYAWQPIKIINPYSEKVSQRPGNESGKSIESSLNHAEAGIICSADKDKYTRREKVEVSIQIKDKTVLTGKVCISVAKTGLIVILPFPESKFPVNNNPSLEYYPEMRGLSVSGKVISTGTGGEVENSLVHLSLLNRNSFYSGFFTNKKGRFILTLLDGEGDHDFYADAVKEDLPLKIVLDEEFSTRTVKHTGIPFELSVQERQLVYELCINQQIETALPFPSTKITLTRGTDEYDKSSFYGEPSRIIYTKTYINLPKIEEFIFELIPEFTIEYFRKIPLLKPAVATSFGAWPALVLLDNVPITNLAKFLALPVEKIERIELIDKGYVTGNVRHNGVIHAFSKNRDLGGIDLSGNSVFFKYKMFAAASPLNFPDYSKDNNLSRIPDRRNTLYWNPEVIIKEGLEQKFTFYTADLKGEYEIVVRGLSKDEDGILIGKARFNVE